MSTTAQPSPLLITSGDLISQEEQFIKEYAAYFKLPTDLNRSQLLEKICQLHPGSTPSIPILPHLTFERVNGGKIRFTGRISAGEAHHPATRPAPTRPAVPANRRLVRQSNLLQAIMEAEQRVAVAREQEPSSRENTPLPVTPVDVAPLQQASAGEEPLEDPFNMEHKVNVVLRFPTPVDEFDPPPPRRAHSSGSPDSAASSLPDIPPKRRMKFVYPPFPRTPTDPEQALPGVPRAFSPGDTWVEKMYMDLTRGRRDVKNDLEEVSREVRDATEEVLKAQIEFKREMQSTQDFLDYLKQIASEEWTDEILKHAGRIAEQGSDDSEVFDEADDHSSREVGGVHDDGGQASDHGDSGRDDGDDDGRDTRDDSEVGERSNDRQEGVESDEGSDNNSEGNPSQVPPLCPSHVGKVFFRPCNHTVSLGHITRLRSRSSSEDSPSSPSNRTTTDDAGARNSARGTLNLKRDRDDDFDDGRNTGELSPSSKRAKSSHDAPSNLGNKPAPQTMLPDQANHSLSRKRSRDEEDDNQSSELEVESSIRRSASESSSGSVDDHHQRSRKKARSDDHADTTPRSPSHANPTLSPASSPRARPTNDPPVGGSDSSNSGSEDDEEPVENGWPAGLFGSRGVYDGASEGGEDADSIDGSAPSPGWNSVGTFSPPPGGPRFSYPPGKNPFEPQPIAGPSNPHRTTRPLRRDTERLRETGNGEVEVYDYEEDLQWRRGMSRQRLAVQAHQAHPSYGAALSPEVDFEGLRLPTGWGVEFG